jgi:hypothetical protein
MNIQQARKPAAKVKVTGRPLWHVSLNAWVQRGRKRLKAMWCAAALKQCAKCGPCGPQVLERAA